MHRLHMSSKMHRLNGLEGAQSTGKAFLACMSGTMSFQMTQVPVHLISTDLTLTENTLAMTLLHVSVAFILVSKLLVTDCAICWFPGLAGREGNRFRSRGTNGRGIGNGSRGNLDLDGRNLFPRGEGLRCLSGGTRFGILDGGGF